MEVKTCHTCGIALSVKKSSLLKKMKFCSSKCFHLSRKTNFPTCKACSRVCKGYDREYCSNTCAKKSIVLSTSLTKGVLFANRKNWQSARSAIRRHAVRIFAENIKRIECVCCGYSKHVEICHIKPVAEFEDSALLIEINNISNLVGLCPTHHWEFDNQQMSCENISKIVERIGFTSVS